jgi:hypothetical protein
MGNMLHTEVSDPPAYMIRNVYFRWMKKSRLYWSCVVILWP